MALLIKTQHKINAAVEKLYIAQAANDAHNMQQQGRIQLAKGNVARARFDFEEARNAQSWIHKRNVILHKEQRLSR